MSQVLRMLENLFMDPVIFFSCNIIRNLKRVKRDFALKRSYFLVGCQEPEPKRLFMFFNEMVVFCSNTSENC